MQINIARAAVAGIIGTAVMTVVGLHVAPLMGIPPMNPAVMLAGAMALASLREDVLWAAVVSFGLGWGGVYTVLQLSAINCFGLRSAGKILGTITVLDAIGGGLGIWLTGVLYTTQGSYMLPFVIFCLLISVALLAIGQITYPVSQVAPASKTARA